MKQKERNRLYKKYNHLYRRVFELSLEDCAYCGDKRQCLDHVPAISLVDGINIKAYKENGGKFLLYPACTMCNTFLSNKHIIYYIDRLEYLEDKYNEKISETEGWTEEEIEELGYSLRTMVLNTQNKQQIFLKKLNGVIEKVSNYYSELDQDDL